jgi:hypothetical protein
MNSDHKIAPPVIRLATQADLEGIFQVDPTAKREKLRKEIIRRAVEPALSMQAKKLRGMRSWSTTSLKWALFLFWLLTLMGGEPVWDPD